LLTVLPDLPPPHTEHAASRLRRCREGKQKKMWCSDIL